MEPFNIRSPNFVSIQLAIGGPSTYGANPLNGSPASNRPRSLSACRPPAHAHVVEQRRGLIQLLPRRNLDGT